MPRSLSDELAARVRPADALSSVADAVCTAYRTVIPFGFACLATTDPSTGLISWAWKTRPLEIGDEEWALAEYGGWDVNLFAELAQRDVPVGALSIDTDGHPETCRRMSEFLGPRFGFADELRVVFRTQGLTWGALAMYRSGGEPAFTADEARTAAAVHAQVADLLRQTLFAGRQPAADSAVGPAVIVVDTADRVTNITPAANVRIDDLGGWDNGSLPSTVLAACAAARATPELAMTRAVGRSGSWLVVRATGFAPPAESSASTDSVVVTIDVASTADVSSLALAARALSAREQDVARLVLQGAATKAIASSLFLSPHTVQDHLKSIFVKLGVNSRREMVQQLVIGQ